MRNKKMTLLAKPDETILEHTENALKVFKSIKNAYEKVPELCSVNDFWEHLFYAVFFHDFGKGASGFQNVFNGNKWNYRHEILSAGFISSLNYDELYKEAIGLAIITHHKDIEYLKEKYATTDQLEIGKKRYESKLKELEANFDEIKTYYDKIPEFSEKYLGYELRNFKILNSPQKIVDVYKDIVIKYEGQLNYGEKTELHRKYGIFLKGFLNACDHLASAHKYKILNAVRNMREIYSFKDLRSTQIKALNTKGDSFLTAPTGSGKTEASLFWTDKNQNTQKSRRVFYLLPYTASINAMYERLKSDFRKYLFRWDDIPENNTEFIKFLKDALKTEGVENAEIKKSDNNETITVMNEKNVITIKLDKKEKNVTLEITGGKTYEYFLKEEKGKLNIYFGDDELVGIQHGKANYFLYKAFLEEEDYTVAKNMAKNMTNLTKKIYGPYKVLTPFQILKAFFGMYWFEMQLSEMANGLFILDEIHAYDAHTTSLILECLKILKHEYKVNLFIMSATLPKFIKELFREILEIDNEIFIEKNELKEFTRHRVKILDGNIIDNMDKIKSDLKSKRVLVVCNTVSRAQEVFKELSKTEKNSVLLHGRFMLRDREKIEKRLNEVNLLVGTQAIEVSLNIDYDILYTEPAPIDALIQRFGRVNRKGWEKQIIAPVNILSEGSDKDKYIYTKELVNRTIEKLKEVDLLEEDMIQEIVDDIYKEGYVGKDKEDFEKVKENFKLFYNEVVPFIYEKTKEEDFYSLFKSYDVVPFQYKLEYLDEIKNGRYLEAIGYFTSISIGQFKKLKNENRIEMDGDNKTYFVNAKYTSELGLIIDEEDDNII